MSGTEIETLGVWNRKQTQIEVQGLRFRHGIKRPSLGRARVRLVNDIRNETRLVRGTVERTRLYKEKLLTY